MKFLVTGGAGRLGSLLCKLISSFGGVARAFDLPNVRWDDLSEISGVDIYKGDVTNASSVDEACEDIDAVFHLAALLPPRSEADRDLSLRVNVGGTRNIIEALSSRRNPLLMLASSISTYGITASENQLISEEHPQVSHNVYSESKIEAEKVVRASGLPHVILRVAPIAVAELLELPDVVPYGADQRVEFVDVEDVALAFHEASRRPEANGMVLNVAGGPSWRMTGAEYIERFYEALGIEVEPNFSDEYTAVDWYDTSRSRFLEYQRTSFNDFQGKLRLVAEELGLI